MRVLRLLSAALAALLSSACLVVSLQPVYEPETIAFDPALLGSWLASDDGTSVVFERAEWHSYHVTIVDGDKRTRLSARLTRVGERLFLDVSSLDGADVPPLLLVAHGLYRVDLAGDELSLADLNYDRFERLARDGTAGLPLTLDGRKNVVITASTAELRRWLVAHAADEGLFDAPTVMRRKMPSDAVMPR